MTTKNVGPKDLQTYDFEFLTEWELRSGKIKPLTTEWDTSSGWIYAFTVENRIMYIGIATTVLRGRLDGYSYQINDRVGILIRTQLESRKVVSIYGARRPGISKSDLEIEESSLIARFSTSVAWNVRI